MTQNKQFKKRVRARMAKTGESYTAARRALSEYAPQKTIKLRALGFWKSPQEPHWPDPMDLVDASWDAEERRKVVAYLRGAPVVERYFEPSWCRMGCGQPVKNPKRFFQAKGTTDTSLSWQERRLRRYDASKKAEEAGEPARVFDPVEMGSGEQSDGVYLWPEGLAHYLEKHNVRLPGEFVNHVLSNPKVQVPEQYEVDKSWWLGPHTAITSKELTQRWSERLLLQIESPFLSGWYFHDTEYPEEGSNGPYVTREEAETAVRMMGYKLEDVTLWEQRDMGRVYKQHVASQIERQIGDFAEVFKSTVGSTTIRENLEERFREILSAFLGKMEREGVRVPPQEDIELVWPELTEEDRKKQVLRCELKIREAHRYSQFVDALVSEGLLPMQSLVGMGLVEESH